jgi:hypothetical protein
MKTSTLVSSHAVAPRTPLSPTELQQILDSELGKEQRFCNGACRAPLPYRRDPPDAGGSNWQVPPLTCALGCDLLLRGIRELLKDKYDLASG